MHDRDTDHEPFFERGYIPEDGWETYRKKVNTQARRIDGPFRVGTSEGELRCADGYLCIDARGYPYPVAKDEFDLIYGPLVEQAIAHVLGDNVSPPSIGRIVHFHENAHAPALAAIIVHVWTVDMVNLIVFNANGVASARTSVPFMGPRRMPSVVDDDRRARAVWPPKV